MLALLANPLVRKIAIYGAAILAILFALRYWGNAQWSKGEAQGRKAGAMEMEKAKKAEWEAERKTIETEKTALQSERSAVGAQTAQLAATRRDIQSSLEKTLKQITFTTKVNDAAICAIAPSDLDAALRSISAELASVK